MENWNNSEEKDKTYKNFKNVFVVDSERKNLFVPKGEDPGNNNNIK